MPGQSLRVDMFSDFIVLSVNLKVDFIFKAILKLILSGSSMII